MGSCELLMLMFSLEVTKAVNFYRCCQIPHTSFHFRKLSSNPPPSPLPSSFSFFFAILDLWRNNWWDMSSLLRLREEQLWSRVQQNWIKHFSFIIGERRREKGMIKRGFLLVRRWFHIWISYFFIIKAQAKVLITSNFFEHLFVPGESALECKLFFLIQSFFKFG